MKTKTKKVSSGGWRTLEWFLNTCEEQDVQIHIKYPTGAKIKVRSLVEKPGYEASLDISSGDGHAHTGSVTIPNRVAGITSQKQTLDGSTKILKCGGKNATFFERAQIKVNNTCEVRYVLQIGYPGETPPEPSGPSCPMM
jgi:hypothetical protein